MVLKYIYTLLLCGATLISVAQNNLFFTDSYNTNLFEGQENTITFNNNVFSILNKTDYQKIDSVFQNFFKENHIKVDGTYKKNDFSFTYHYVSTNQDYLAWSRNWYKSYEMNLIAILKNYSNQYIKNGNTTFPSIHHAVQDKLILNTSFSNYNRINEVSSSKISITSKTVNPELFIKENIQPNNSLKRTITSGKNNYFNEAFQLSEPTKYQYFIIAPNSKSRLIDCFSAHLFCKILDIDAPVYLNNISYVQFNKIDTSLFTEAAIKNKLNESKLEFDQIINTPSISFYSLSDKNDIKHTLSSYNLKDLKKFIKLYFIKNTVNEAFTLENPILSYHHTMMNDSIHFKVNSYKFKLKQDSLQLASIAEFLIKNPLKEIQILGVANQNEYFPHYYSHCYYSHLPCILP